MSEGRPPLYIRRPFVAGLVRQLPLVAVLAVVAVGVALVAVEHWRRGLTVMGLALVGAALLRLFLPERRVGFLAVRSRPVDVVLLAAAGLALTTISLAIPGLDY